MQGLCELELGSAEEPSATDTAWKGREGCQTRSHSEWKQEKTSMAQSSLLQNQVSGLCKVPYGLVIFLGAVTKWPTKGTWGRKGLQCEGMSIMVQMLWREKHDADGHRVSALREWGVINAGVPFDFPCLLTPDGPPLWLE